MALLHQAELRPSKIELVRQWAPSRPWFEDDAGAGLTSIASFRFDDPDGEVGIETLLVGAGDGLVLQVPLTYRGVPLDGGDSLLVGTMEHSVLGRRWVYDAVGDPAYLLAAATAALTGGRQAELYIDIDGRRVRREPTALVAGSGTSGMPALPILSADEVTMRHERGSTVVGAGRLILVVARTLRPMGPDARRLLDLAPTATAAHAELMGTWPGQPTPRALALALVR